MSGVVLAGAIVASLNGGACVLDDNPRIELVINVSELSVKTDLDRLSIASLARGRTQDGEYPLGFYTNETSYVAKVDFIRSADPSCHARIRTTLTVNLVDRVIEIAQDLRANACVFKGAVDHYVRIAAADERALVARSKLLADSLRARGLPPLEPDKPVTDETLRDAAIRSAKSAFASADGAIKEAREHARAAARAETTADRILKSCRAAL